MTDVTRGRIIGIRHRVKRTAAGEAHPTQLAILEHGVVRLLDLETERDELDWVLRQYPTSWRKIVPEDDLSGIAAHHIKWRKVKLGEDVSAWPERLLDMRSKKEVFIADKVPTIYDGLRDYDTIAIAMGGTGDRFAFALSRRADTLEQARVLRLPSFLLKEECGENKDQHAECLARLAATDPELFRETTVRDRELILFRECLRARIDAMKARIATEQQLRQSFIGRIFCDETGGYPEGLIEVAFDQLKANDDVLAGLETAEKKREKELIRAVEALLVYQVLFQPIEGCGPMIAARLIAAIGDVRQFATDAKLKAYCGVHVLDDGRFPRKRGGELANWSGEARQALYLIGDQFNRRPDSVWGKKLREYKEKLRAKHPLPLSVGVKFSTLFRSIERFYLARGASTDPSMFNLKTVDGLYEYFLAGQSELYGNLADEADGVSSELFERDRDQLLEFQERFEALGKGSNGSVVVYSPGHIHKMATWRTLTKFVEWLYKEWVRLEREAARAQSDQSV